MNVLPELELLMSLANLDRADFAGSLVDILKQMPVNGLKVRKIERPSGYTFSAALDDDAPFDRIECDRVGDAEPIFEGLGTRIDVRIVRAVHLAASALARSRM